MITHSAFRLNRVERIYHLLDGEIQRCGNLTGAGQCPSGFICLQGLAPNPNNGYTSFDTYGWSVLSTIRLLLKDFWEDLLYNVVKTNGPIHALVFYVYVLYSYLIAALIWGFFAVAYLTNIKRTVPKPDDDVLDQTEEIENQKEANGGETEAVPTGESTNGQAC